MDFCWEVRLMTLSISGGGVLRINREPELPANFKQKFGGLALDWFDLKGIPVVVPPSSGEI